MRLLRSHRLVLEPSRLDRRCGSLALRVRVVTTETLPAVLPLEPTTPIKPSEAIRLGCLIAPVQTSGVLIGPTTNGNRSACANGAMLLGFGERLRNSDAAIAAMGRHSFFDLDQPNVTCPAPTQCQYPRRRRLMTPAHMVEHLNDYSGGHEWSRERIADWLAEQGL